MILHFILGGNMNETQWAGLGVQISNYYKGHLPGTMNLDFVFHRYTDDSFSLIQQSYPVGPLFLLGHSFGGCRVSQVAAQFGAVGRTVDHAILFDPVEITAWNVPNVKGFPMSANVAEAVCFYRGATEPPFSGFISGGKNFKNILFPASGGGSAAYHGSAVWDWQPLNLISQVAAGATMLPAVAPTPVPAPVPVPVAKTVVGVTLTYSDGSQQTIKVP